MMAKNLVHRDVRSFVYERDQGRCWYCGALHPEEAGTRAPLDHQTPTSRGGPHTADNLVVTCHTCNARKGPKTVEEFREMLKLRTLASYRATAALRYALAEMPEVEQFGLLEAIAWLEGETPDTSFYGEAADKANFQVWY